MSTEDNKAVVRRVIEGVWSRGDLSIFAELFEPATLSASTQRHTQNAREVQLTARLYRAAFPDLRVVIDDLLADGDQVVARFTFHGTHTGFIQGVAGPEAIAGLAIEEDRYRPLLLSPPTGRQTTFEGIALFGFSGEKVSSFWHLLDELELLRQVGVLPSVGSLPHQ